MEETAAEWTALLDSGKQVDISDVSDTINALYKASGLKRPRIKMGHALGEAPDSTDRNPMRASVSEFRIIRQRQIETAQFFYAASLLQGVVDWTSVASAFNIFTQRQRTLDGVRGRGDIICDGLLWTRWAGLADFFRKANLLGKVPTSPVVSAGTSVSRDDIYQYVDLLKAGVATLVATETTATVYRLPTKVLRDENGALHSDIGPAVEWADEACHRRGAECAGVCDGLQGEVSAFRMVGFDVEHAVVAIRI